MSAKWYTGNAVDDGDKNRGWLLGHFIQPIEDIRSTSDLEVKWGIHPAGQQRPEWTADDRRTTLLLLISGRFRLDLTVDSVTLARQGDYVMWGPGIDHSWQAEDNSTVVTIRWPSLS
ncbi:signal peptidase I [Pseudonocardia spinosispora]|uniref:signal peptidase I n=1 Tax=Pseudonocardia spinosispora TaxID=103441 RepID=UPI000491139D|nr:signal peptidase I [Pseudonocardia spinosispora]